MSRIPHFIEVARETADGLSRKIWRFHLVADWSQGIKVRIDQYQDQTRTSKRHRWVTQRGNGQGLTDESGRSRKDPYPLPGDVTREAMAFFQRRVSDAFDICRGEHAGQYGATDA